jgi:hypothetical protein
MTFKAQSNKEKNGINCQRCGGRMASHKFYGGENVYFGWHCIMCGEILDPVILLHRLSQNASIVIPEDEEEIISLIKKYLPRPKNSLNGKSS